MSSYLHLDSASLCLVYSDLVGPRVAAWQSTRTGRRLLPSRIDLAARLHGQVARHSGERQMAYADLDQLELAELARELATEVVVAVESALAKAEAPAAERLAATRASVWLERTSFRAGAASPFALVERVTFERASAEDALRGMLAAKGESAWELVERWLGAANALLHRAAPTGGCAEPDWTYEARLELEETRRVLTNEVRRDRSLPRDLVATVFAVADGFVASIEARKIAETTVAHLALSAPAAPRALAA